MSEYRTEWEDAAKKCGMSLGRMYLNERPSPATLVDFVAAQWKRVLENVNPEFVTQNFSGKSFGQLTVDEMLALEDQITPPDMSLAVFTLLVRRIAAVVQKVA